MKHIPSGKMIVVVEAVSWQDLEDLRPMQCIQFDDFDSWLIIREWCEENKDMIADAFMSWQWGKNLFFWSDVRGGKPWHLPSECVGEYVKRKPPLTFDDVVKMGLEEMAEARRLVVRPLCR